MSAGCAVKKNEIQARSSIADNKYDVKGWSVKVYYISEDRLEKVLKEKNTIIVGKESGYKNYQLEDLTEKEVIKHFQCMSITVFTYWFNYNINSVKDYIIRIF